VKAFVVLRKGATLTVEQVEDHVRSRLAPFKVPTIVEFVPSLPLTRSDKVARVSLGSSEVSVALGSRHDGKEGMA
jgi:acyl-coenzyme A synthetase/AMP-(fatty) acid ligase